jgi:hypothetical protein
MRLILNPINNDNPSEGTLYYDVHGNIILKFGENHYFVDIDKNDELEFVEIENIDNLEEAEKKSKYKSIKNTNEQYSLRGKAIDEIEKERDEKENYFDDEYDDEDPDYKERYKYCPESKYYYVIDEDDNLDEENSDNDEHIYSKFGNNDIITCFYKTLGSSSLYDVLIFDKNNKMVLKTIESKESNSYKVIITTCGEFELNIIGNKRIRFVPNYKQKDENIIPFFTKIHSISV